MDNSFACIDWLYAFASMTIILWLLWSFARTVRIGKDKPSIINIEKMLFIAMMISALIAVSSCLIGIVTWINQQI